MQRPQSTFTHALLERTHQLLTGLILLVVHQPVAGKERVDWFDLFADELVDPVEVDLELRFDGKIKGHG
ncbi:unannotated protein [freshwater metagenome]|uniref:Unannotated protein n=1 Tax=freshwater metagenome TaxID=449393 RepID=A0A6J7C164_9ZZZZ